MPNYNLFNSPIMQATWQDPVNAEFLRGVAQSGGAPQLQEAVADEQAQNNFNRDMANNALMAEMANRGAYSANTQSPVLVQGFMPALGEAEASAQQQEQPQPRKTLNQMAKVFADQIVQSKYGHREAEKQGNAEAMAQFHNAAEQARANMRQLGYDPAAYGLDGTYEEATQEMNKNNLQALQNVLDGDNSQSSIGYYDDTYNYLINQGYSREIAAEVAGQKARTYAIQRIRTLEDAFNMYGHDGKVINPMGVQILQKLAEEEPDMTNYYTQRYAGPLQEYADAKQQRNMATQQANKERTMAIGHNYDLENKDVDQQHRIQMANLNYQIQEAHANNNVVRAVQQAGQLYELQAKYGIGKGAANRNGISKEQATQAANMIKQIDAKLKDGLDLSDTEKAQLNADRAKYQSVVDAYIGFGGQQSGGNFAQYGDIYNDYDAFIKYATDVYNENGKTGELSNPEIFERLRQINPQFAESIPEAYRNTVSSSGGNSTQYGGGGGSSNSAPAMYVDPAVKAQAQAIYDRQQAARAAEEERIRQRRAEAANVRQWNPNG